MEVINALGRRKAAVARVFVSEGKGQITINKRELANYFPSPLLQYIVKQPLNKLGVVEKYDIRVNLGGGGYNAEILSGIVGPSGHVLLVNNPGYDGFGKKGWTERLANDRLPNVQHIVGPTDALGMGDNTLDGAVIVMSYHDRYWVNEKDGWPKIDAGQFLDQIARALKPGGVLLVVDHSAKEGTGSSAAQTLHRIDEQFAIADFRKHGLVWEAAMPYLRNPDDDRSKRVFDPAIRGKTDRFVHLYRKPG